MNGTESPESQKPPPSSAGTNGHASTNSSLAAKKRKKDGLKPIITMEGASPHPAIGQAPFQRLVRGRSAATHGAVLHHITEDGSGQRSRLKRVWTLLTQPLAPPANDGWDSGAWDSHPRHVPWVWWLAMVQDANVMVWHSQGGGAHARYHLTDRCRHSAFCHAAACSLVFAGFSVAGWTL
ncbi:uncharacterized protein NECHADRAFT_78279 [Fusarium vanettenii 77-13-4]|uniref:Uncharacterized protein n=1 Tax=Fusarium vanettenii (strain ATCC MYA-4622 / CBS 123669 / FGSC 9596 / NRRL 45880 / 77-13-4) TaxID=660122 RepID=C7ZL04_FUSV7|nr:uncharacterized protein NECHADRAFT_78279 [Fusarium vanettenii 77-13-4]EEU35289.1 predicted protein [Fusarium vanettenii 77-13-4]